MRFVIDAQLPPALARLLAAHGHQAEHVADSGLRDADDSPIWGYALQQQAIIITKDEDFPHRLSQSIIAPVIVTKWYAYSKWILESVESFPEKPVRFMLGQLRPRQKQSPPPSERGH
jgi:uncharacterized protein with PIN domain